VAAVAGNSYCQQTALKEVEDEERERVEDEKKQKWEEV
jgi:hypothetical protein